MKLDFMKVGIIGITGEKIAWTELEWIVKGIWLGVWQNASDPALSDLGREIWKLAETDVTYQQLEQIKAIVNENKVWFPAVTVRAIGSYVATVE